VSEGPASLAARIEDAPDALTWLLEGADADPMAPDLTSTEKSERVSRILDVLAAIPDTILRHEECRRLSRHAAIPLEILWDRVKPKTAGRAGAPRPGAEAAFGPGTRGNPAVLQGAEIPASERRLLQILIGEPEHKPLILGTLKDDFLTHPASRRVVEALRKAPQTAETVDFQRQIAHLTEEDRILLSGIALEDHPSPTEKGVEGLLKDLEKKYLERESADIQRAIERAEASSSADLEELIRAKEENSRRRVELSRAPHWKGN